MPLDESDWKFTAIVGNSTHIRPESPILRLPVFTGSFTSLKDDLQRAVNPLRLGVTQSKESLASLLSYVKMDLCCIPHVDFLS